MYHGMGVPGGWEALPIIFFSCFVYLLPLAFAVFVIIFLVKINSTVEAIRKKLEQQEQNKSAT